MKEIAAQILILATGFVVAIGLGCALLGDSINSRAVNLVDKGFCVRLTATERKLVLDSANAQLAKTEGNTIDVKCKKDAAP